MFSGYEQALIVFDFFPEEIIFSKEVKQNVQGHESSCEMPERFLRLAKCQY